MPMRYANDAQVYATLDITGDAEAQIQADAVEAGLAAVLDHEIGTSFGVAPVAETRTIVVGDQWMGAFGLSPYAYLGTSLAGPSPLITDFPIRSVTSITTGGIWDGSTWTNITALDADQYRLTYTTRDGVSYGIELASGYWSGPVHITGIWADQATEAVPADVREAMNTLTVKQYRRLTSSPTDQVGPEGLIVPTPDGWRDTFVQKVIDKYRVVQVLV